ncbi:TRAP transporter large permease [Azospirillum sp. ST 5-10]|uniref:TRAP transporter large permease n=1 Tax=unclassified Azospirillum TaxID=2630922 RepID=UPI003F49DEF8
MEPAHLFSVALLLAAGGAIITGFPVAFALAGSSLLVSLLGVATGQFDLFFLSALPSRLFGGVTNEVLLAVPLFIFMGVMLERSRIAEDLLKAMGQCFGALPGGLGLSVTLVGMLMAASTGIVGATVITMGLLSLPSMLQAGYDRRLATGVICASGALGQIIPPSIALVLLGDMLGNIHMETQLAQGNFMVEPVSVIDLFIGALIPGLLLVGLYIAYLVGVAVVRPRACPPYYEKGVARLDLAVTVLRALVPPVFLVVAVLGSIIGGVATPTEAAAFGAVGAVLLAGAKRTLAPAMLGEVARVTTRMTCNVYTILLGASVFSLTFRGFGGDDLVHEVLNNLPGGVGTAMMIIMLLMFLMGFILDFVEIVFIVVPLVAPALLAAGIDPIWLGVMIGMNLQTSFLTPPFGWCLFYLRATAPAEVRTTEIYQGVVPFVMLQVLGLGILAAFPILATWLPHQIF